MPQKPKLESVVVLLISVATLGMTVASVFMFAQEPAEVTAAPAARTAVPAAAPAAVPGAVPGARAAAPAPAPVPAPAAAAPPDAGAVQCKLDRKTAPAVVPATGERGDKHRGCKGSLPPGRST